MSFLDSVDYSDLKEESPKKRRDSNDGDFLTNNDDLYSSNRDEPRPPKHETNFDEVFSDDLHGMRMLHLDAAL